MPANLIRTVIEAKQKILSRGDAEVRGDLDVDGTITTGEANITNETYIEASRSADSSRIGASVFTNPFDTEDADVRGEFDSNLEFAPDRDGIYHFNVTIHVRGSDGDEIQCRIYNIDKDSRTTPPFHVGNISGSETIFAPVDIVTGLSAGTTYSVEVTDKGSDFIIKYLTKGKISREIVHRDS